jgi:hypothetical protein
MLNKNKFVLLSETFRVTKSQRSACTTNGRRKKSIQNYIRKTLRRPLVKYRQRCEDTIKMYLKGEWKSLDLIKLAEGRDKWRIARLEYCYRN